MASFVVETYVPSGDRDRFEADADGIRVAADALVAADARVRHVRSYFVPSDEMGFHVVEAERLEDVTRLTSMAGVEAERIVEVVGVGPRSDLGDEA